MSSRLMVQTMEEKARQYWQASRQWRGDIQWGHITVGDILRTLANLAGDLNQQRWSRAENLTAALLDAVINNRKCRKSKDTGNVVYLAFDDDPFSRMSPIVGTAMHSARKGEILQVKVG